MARIFVHASKAHADDMVACAILITALRQKGVRDGDLDIIRTNSVKDVKPPYASDDYVLDVGRKYDGKRFFDHHQTDDPRVVGECAATLVAEAYLPAILEDEIWGKYLRRIALMDNEGMGAVVAELGCHYTGTLLTMEKAMVKLFETQPKTVATMVAALIEERLSSGDERMRAEKWVNSPENVSVVEFGGVHGLIIKKNPFTEGGFSNIDAVNTAQNPLITEWNVGFVYSWDPRDKAGVKRSLFRTSKNPGGIDFTKSRPLNGDSFCHNAGFLLNFFPSSEDEWKELLWQAMN